MARKRYERIIASVLTAVMTVGGAVSVGSCGFISRAQEAEARTSETDGFSIESNVI